MSTNDIRAYLAEIARRGGSRRVKKGFGTMSPEAKAEAIRKAKETREAKKVKKDLK